MPKFRAKDVAGIRNVSIAPNRCGPCARVARHFLTKYNYNLRQFFRLFIESLAISQTFANEASNQM